MTGAPAEQPVRYELDASQSKFTVQAFAAGVLGGFGHDPSFGIQEFSGEIRCSPRALEQASLRVVVKAASLRVIDDIKDQDREEIDRNTLEQVLEASIYPEIVFSSTSVVATSIVEGRFRVRIIGDLTLHGATRSIWIPAQVEVSDDDLRARDEFTLKQTDFGIKPVSVAGGTLKVKDELKFSFDIVGHRTSA